MPVEAGHIQIQEFTKEVIPSINWMMEDLFCRYGVAMPYFLLDFAFPDYSQRPEWVTYTPPDWYLPEWKAYWPTFLNQWPNWMEGTGFNFNIDWGPWGFWLPWFNELLGLLFDAAELPRWQMPDFSPSSIEKLNSVIRIVYEAQRENIEVGDNITVAEAVTVGVPTTTTMFWTTTEAECAYLTRGYSDSVSWADTWSNFLTSTITPIENIVTNRIYIYYYWAYNVGAGGAVWQANAARAYISFDTSSLAGKTVTAAELRLDFSSIIIHTVEQNRSVNLYKKDWGAVVDTGDWNVGDGTLISTTDQPSAGPQPRRLTLDPSDVNTTGASRFMLANKADVDGDVPDGDPEVLYGDPSGYIGGCRVYFDEDRTAQFQPALVVTWR